MADERSPWTTPEIRVLSEIAGARNTSGNQEDGIGFQASISAQ